MRIPSHDLLRALETLPRGQKRVVESKLKAVLERELLAIAEEQRRGRNEFKDLSRFIAEWDAKAEGPPRRRQNSRARTGQINTTGSADCYTAEIYTPREPEFMNAIESGVRELVELIVGAGYITYSSCEGHPAANKEALRTRHVGIVPRNARERTRLLAAIAAAASSSRPSARVRVDVEIGMIHTSHRAVPCVDIWFDAHCPPGVYFRAVEPVYRNFVAELRRTLQPTHSSTGSTRSSARHRRLRVSVAQSA